jgi:hypothetical protein
MPSLLLAIDPGAAHVGLVIMEQASRRIIQCGELTPAEARAFARGWGYPALTQVVVEGVTNYGTAAGKDTFGTCIQIGRLVEILLARDFPVTIIYRPHVRLTVGGSPRAREPEIKASLRSWYGGEKAAKGNKANPGPLYHVKGHAWSALALAFAFLMDRTPQPLSVEPLTPDF